MVTKPQKSRPPLVCFDFDMWLEAGGMVARPRRLERPTCGLGMTILFFLLFTLFLFYALYWPLINLYIVCPSLIPSLFVAISGK